ncbi:MAG: hypothetical protein KJ634_00940 [Gammaproteobacteria bacterium]|nr:hypothetical protein [Gammaproteobacteria bacterium]MBU1414164.1 hypothetical protein [Gammaproteobacteria bacterium]
MRHVRLVFLLLAAAAVIFASWMAPLDPPAAERVDAGLKRALVSFASARALNAVISMVQGTEVSAQPMGFGVVFTPGQVLDPVNDLVETFADAMLAASVAFGVEKVLISVGGYWLVSLLLSVVALVWAVTHVYSQASPVWLSRLLLILLMVRFAMPAVTLGSDLLFEKFLAADYAANQQAIDVASGQMESSQPPVATTTEEGSLIDRMKGWLADKDLDVSARFEALKQTAEKITERVISLIVIFLLQTLIIPLLLLWALYSAGKGALATAWVPAPRTR